MAMTRNCPNCSERTIAASALIASSGYCSNCGSDVGVHWFWRTGFVIATLIVAVPTTVAVFAQQGIYAALLWAPFPIGALGYLKARFCPLVTKQKNTRGHSVTG